MKYWIIPNILDFFGMGIAMFILILIQLTPKEIDETMNIALLGTAVGIMGVMFGVAAMYRFSHFKRILKKHGLWQDEEIRKKDLPK